MKQERTTQNSGSEQTLYISSPMLSFLKEAEAVTLRSLEHLLLFISDPKGHSKWSSWSAISKLMKTIVTRSDTNNEFEKVDASLQCLISGKSSSTINHRTSIQYFWTQFSSMNVTKLYMNVIKSIFLTEYMISKDQTAVTLTSVSFARFEI